MLKILLGFQLVNAISPIPGLFLSIDGGDLFNPMVEEPNLALDGSSGHQNLVLVAPLGMDGLAPKSCHVR